MSGKISPKEAGARATNAIIMTVLYIVLYVVVSAVVRWFIRDYMPSLGINVREYEDYIQILLAIAFGYIIVSSISNVFYWTLRAKYSHATAAAVRNVVKIIGLGALVASIAGAVAGGAAGVALAGFLGLVIGFATQQVLGQAVAGLFILIARPFKIGDLVVIAGEEGVVVDVSSLFTMVRKADNVEVLIPNNTIIGGKIYIKQRSVEQS